MHVDPWVSPSNTEMSPLGLDYMASWLLYPN